MPSIVSWVISLAVGLSAVVLTAGAGQRLFNLAAAGVVSLVFAFLAVREHRTLAAAGASDVALSASNARYMGLVWAWGALSLFAVYNFILKWPEWLQFFAGFAVAAVLSLFISTQLDRDAAGGKRDDTMMKLARFLAIGQLVGMAAGIIGLLVDGKMMRYVDPLKYPDWVANNVFFFGAVALILISANALRGATKSAL